MTGANDRPDAHLAGLKANGPPKDSPHDWQPSTLGHGELMCARCFVTNREAAALGLLLVCTTSMS